MKVLIANTFEMKGGTGRAASRLHHALLDAGIDSRFYVQIPSGDSLNLIAAKGKLARGVDVLRPTLDQLPLYLFERGWHQQQFSTQWFPDRMLGHVLKQQPDVVHLHWICKGFIRIETLAKINQPVVWTIHDMWPFTGGCHHSESCNRFEHSCGACPLLGSHREQDTSRWVWKRKQKAWKNRKFVVVSPSRWLAEQASRSSLFQDKRIEVIANGVDLERYHPVDRNYARQLLHLPAGKMLILFGAADVANTKKGLPDLIIALEHLAETEWRSRIELVVIGASSFESQIRIPYKTHALGRFSDDISLALVYGAVDLFVAPSLMDTLPNMVMEAMACGTPCVANQVGGLPDLIDHQLNGYLAVPGDIESLANGIKWVLEDKSRWQSLSSQARIKVEQEFNLKVQAERYIDIYRELLEPPTPKAVE